MKPRVLGLQLTSANFDARWGRLICFTCGLAVLLLGFGSLDKPALTEGEVLLAVLSILALALSMVVLGQLLWLSRRMEP